MTQDKQKNYYQKHREAILQKEKEKRPERREYHRYYQKERRKTKQGRAQQLLDAYRYKDRLNKRGETTITKEWILENIFTSYCMYCGEPDWGKLGCDRIDNEKAHTPDNCVCACKSCNSERQYKGMSVEEFKRLKGGPELDHPAANNM